MLMTSKLFSSETLIVFIFTNSNKKTTKRQFNSLHSFHLTMNSNQIFKLFNKTFVIFTFVKKIYKKLYEYFINSLININLTFNFSDSINVI